MVAHLNDASTDVVVNGPAAEMPSNMVSSCDPWDDASKIGDPSPNGGQQNECSISTAIMPRRTLVGCELAVKADIGHKRHHAARNAGVK